VDERTERKVVTILFCDLVGFTSAFDLADPEDLQQALAAYHATVVREIERFGGTPEKFIGDAVMAVYGAPVAHEDDAQRALFSALRIPPAIEELNATTPGLELAVRIAVETGDAVVTPGADMYRQGIAVGDVVNTASRLQNVAPPGGVVAGERTHRLTRDLFDFDELEPVRVKGKSVPLHLWRVRSARSRFGDDVSHATPTPFVGREDELELLKRTFARAVREPSVQLVTLMGEPGVGKSRLIREFFGYIDEQPDPVAWRQGRCLPYGEGVTFWALAQIVKAQAGILESEDAQDVRDKLATSVGAFVPDPLEQEWIRAKLAPLVGLGDPQAEGADRSETFSAWRGFLEAIATRYPLVMVVEDAHWADAALLGFIEHVVAWAAHVPILIVCSARPELFEREPHWGGGQRNSSIVSLTPLSPDETELLVESLLPPGTDAAVRDLLVERVGGNPLFAEEFVRMLREREVSGDGALPLEAALGLAPPESLQAIIAARLDALPLEQKLLLQDASVVGRVFWPGALGALGASDPATVRSLLHELSHRELIRTSRSSSVKDEQEFSFSHSLIRDVAYGQIPRGPRAEKHVAAAGWIEALAGERVSEYAELLASHYERALELSRSAGASVTELEDAARRAWVLAGERSMSLDVSSADGFFEKALQVFPPGDPGRADTLARRAEAMAHAGRFQEAQELYEEAIEGFRDAGDRVEQGACLDRLATVLWGQGDTRGCRERRREAVAALEDEPPGPHLVECYASLASDQLVNGHFDDAIGWAQRAIDLAQELADERVRPRALSYRGMARCYLGDRGGLDDIGEALASTERLGLSRENARVLLILAEVAWAFEGPIPALDATERGAELAERRGLGEMGIACRVTGLGPLFDLGRWDELLVEATHVIERSSEVGGSYDIPLTLPWQLQVQLWRGERDRARELSEDLVEVARRIRDPQVLVPAFAAVALVAIHDGDGARAMSLVAQLEEIPEVSIDWYREQAIADLVRVCALAGDRDAAARLLDRATPVTRRHRLGLQTAQAVVAEAFGDLDDAAGRYDEVAAAWSEYGSLPETGHALLGAGRARSRLGDPSTRERLRNARAIFERLGATALVAETDRVLADSVGLAP
jgi:class 3 adenylate cyclase/tetratricopeptide (TPR) repeat protein